MKKTTTLITILLIASLVLQSLGLGFIFPIKTVRAATLSTSMFPSTLNGLPLVNKISTRSGTPCYGSSQEFVAGGYYSESKGQMLAVNFIKFPSAAVAESECWDCITYSKAQYTQGVSWTSVKDVTVSGYHSIYIEGSAPAESTYIGLLYTFVQEYAITVLFVAMQPVSESTIKSIGASMIPKLPVVEEGKDDGQPCTENKDCKSKNCQHERCCVKNKECCWNHSECPDGQYCDQEAMYCMVKKENGQECKNNFYCKSGLCESYVCLGKSEEVEKKPIGQVCSQDSECESGICERGPNSSGVKYCCLWGEECCSSHSDCRSNQWCNTEYGQCVDLKEVEGRCPGDYACKSGYCKNGWCRIKEEKPIGQDCWENDECESGYCGNYICCQKGEYCCQSDNDCTNVLGDWWECKDNNYCWENVEGRKAFKRGRDGECEYTEPCETLDCMASGRCTIEEACEWGGPGARTAVGCIAAIAADLNIVAQVVDILQNAGCGIVVNFIAGLLEQNINKVTSALVNIVYTAISIVKLKVGTVIKFIFNVFVCIDNYFGFSTWFLLDLIPATMGVINSVAQEVGAAVGLGSPASLMVTDSQGRKTGIDEQGRLHNDIPGSFYVEFPKADIKLVVLPDAKDEDFSVETKGEKQSEIDLMITRANTEGETENIEFHGVSQQKGTKTEISFNSKLGTDVGDMQVTTADGKKRTEQADQIVKEKVEVPKEYRVGGLFNNLKKFFTSTLFIVIILGVLLIAAAYGAFKKFGMSKKTWIIIGIVALIVILVLVFTVFNVFKKKGAAKKDTDSGIEVSSPTGWSVYEKNNFSVFYPSEWNKKNPYESDSHLLSYNRLLEYGYSDATAQWFYNLNGMEMKGQSFKEIVETDINESPVLADHRITKKEIGIYEALVEAVPDKYVFHYRSKYFKCGDWVYNVTIMCIPKSDQESAAIVKLDEFFNTALSGMFCK